MGDDLVIGIDNKVTAEVGNITRALEGLGTAVDALDGKLKGASAKAQTHFKGMVPTRPDDSSLREFTDAFKSSQAAQLEGMKTHMKAMQDVVARSTTSMQSMVDASKGSGGLPDTLRKAKPAADDLSKSFRRLTLDGNDVHSMARGLASGFNLLWLTWGNLAPLFAGAAISNGFVQTTKTGMAVAHTMETIAVLGENTREEMALLTQELDRLGRSGPFGPMEVAKAMKNLSLAGLKANEILAVTPTVLNFAVAGTTDLETSAKTLMTVSTAFSMGIEGFRKVADLISYASAKSMTSVESFSAAMKQASVINSQYGVSIEDVTLGIMTLSKVGIEHSAAGTALRNSYSDLSGRTKQVTKLLESQGIVTRNLKGEMLPLVDIIANLDTALSKLKGQAQADLLKGLTSERGSKMIVEMWQSAREASAKSGVSIRDALIQSRAALEDYYGFATVSAAKLAQTTENQFKQLKAVIQTTMNQAYREMEPQLYLVADALQKAFASPDAVAGLTALVTGVANLAVAVAKNLDLIVLAVAAYGALKVAQVTALGLTSALEAATILKGYATAKATSLTAFDTVATELNTAAQTKNAAAKAGAGVAIGGLARLLPILNVAIGLGTAAWIGWEWWSSKSKDVAKDSSELFRTKTLEDLRTQNDKLEAINKLRREGLSLSEAEARFAGKKSVETAALGVESAAESVRKARAVEDDLASKSSNFETLGVNHPSYKMHQNSLTRAAARTKTAMEKYTEELTKQSGFEEALKAEAERSAKLAREEAGFIKDRTPKTVGTKGLDTDPDRTSTPSYTDSLDRMKSVATARAQTEKDMYNESVQALKMYHAAGLLSEGQYQVEMAKAARQHYLNVEQSTKDEVMAATWVYEERMALTKKGAEGDQQRAKLKEALTSTVLGYNEKLKQSESEYNKSVMAGATASFVETKRLLQESDKFIAAQERKVKVESDIAAARKAAEDQGPAALAALEARITAESAYEGQIVKVQEALEKQETISDAAWEAAAKGVTGMAAAASDADKRIIDLLAELNKLRAAAGGAGATAAATASSTYVQKEFESSSKKIGSDLADAIMAGGKEGGASLKKWFKDKFVLAPIKAFLEVLVQPIAQMAAGVLQGAAGSALGGAAASAGSGLLGGAMGGLMGSMGAFGSGLSSGLTAWGAGGSVTGLLGSGSSLFAGGIANGLGTLAGALGPIALGLMVLSSLVKKSTPHMGAGATYSAAGGLINDEATYKVQGAYGFADTRTFSAEAAKVTSDFAKTMVTVLDKTATTFGKTAGYEASTAFADDSSKDGSWGALTIKKLGQTVLDWTDTQTSKWAPKEFADGDTGSAEYAAALAASVRDVMMQMDLPAWAEDYLTKIGDAPTMDQLSWAVDQINAGAAALEKMAQGLVGFATLSTAAVSKLVAASGGMDLLTANATAYYDNFYSEAEKTANTTKQITKSLAEVGLVMPTTRKGFRELVEQQMSLGESGMEAVAALFSVSAAFASITESSADLSATVDKFRDLADTITEFRKGLLLGDSSNLSPKQKYEQARGEFSSVLALAKTGDETALGKITNVSQAFLDASKESSISALAYSSDFNAVQRALSDSAIAANAKADVAQLQLEAANATIFSITEVNASVQEVVTAVQTLNTAATAANSPIATAILKAFNAYEGEYMYPLTGGTDGSHADGLAYVPFDGYRAELHKGERVLTAQESKEYGNSATLEGLVKELIAKVSNLESSSRATAFHTSETNKRLDRVIPEGDAVEVRIVT